MAKNDIIEAEINKVLDFIKTQEDLDESILDDMVHDTASSMASDANNGGFRAQVEFLLKTSAATGHGGTPEDIIKHIKENL